MSIRKRLAEDMEAEANSRRLERYRKLLSPELASAAATQGEAVDAAQMPSMEGIAAKMAAKHMDASDEDWGATNADALAAFEEDEEDAKWMAKQKG